MRDLLSCLIKFTAVAALVLAVELGVRTGVVDRDETIDVELDALVLVPFAVVVAFVVVVVVVEVSFSFWRLKLRRRHLSDALAKCHARRGRILTGGYASNASSSNFLNFYIRNVKKVVSSKSIFYSLFPPLCRG